MSSALAFPSNQTKGESMSVRTYNVTMTQYKQIYTTLTVEAKNPKQAKAIARELADNTLEWEDGSEYTEIDFEVNLARH